MKNIDLRKSSDNSIFESRLKVVELRKSNVSNRDVAHRLNISEQTASRYYSIYKKFGLPGLKLGKRGRQQNEVKKLTILEERHIIEKIIRGTPDRFDEKRFWTKENVKAFIEKELDINIAMTTVNDYLRRWKLSNSRSVSIEKNISSNISKRWLRRTYTRIEENARQENAEILWGHSFHRISMPDILSKKTKEYDRWKIKCYQFEIVAAYGKKVFMLSPHRYDGYDMIRFLENLIRCSNRKTYLMLNIHKLYPMKPVKIWLNNNVEKIEVHYVPYK